MAQRAWYLSSLSEFADSSDDVLFSRLCQGAASRSFSSESEQVVAWRGQFASLRSTVLRLIQHDDRFGACGILLEYEIPRRSKRIDAVLLIGDTVVVAEYKTSGDQVDSQSLWQVEDYALDLRDFHRESQSRRIVPVLVVTGLSATRTTHHGAGYTVQVVSSDQFAELLLDLRTCPANPGVPFSQWDQSAYEPTPSVIEATCTIFRDHTVEALRRSSADNLDTTLGAVQRIAGQAAEHRSRSICFVTGVPGSGKTLVGLAAVHAGGQDSRGAYLSGNGPLVAVLREAIARDQSGPGSGTTKKAAMRHAQTLVQNVHRFVDEYGIEQTSTEPPENVIVFDEAQRAWHSEKLTKHRNRSSGSDRVLPSEPALALDIMSRRKDWCLLVALVGGGQEIHDGEAGIAEWGRALRESPTKWHVHASPAVQAELSYPESRQNESLHLETVVRSPRATALAQWVDAVLDQRCNDASELASQVAGFRWGLVRELDHARSWLRRASRSEMRPGLVASSGALRLRAEGLELNTSYQRAYPIERWFLDSADDVRSSHQLETAMTEFSCQGLEIDYSCVCWGGDFLLSKATEWNFRRFKGSKWQAVKRAEDQRYLLNKYRVLLTRAREGMLIWVPRGSDKDSTRVPAEYDRVADYLQQCGLPQV